VVFATRTQRCLTVYTAPAHITELQVRNLTLYTYDSDTRICNLV